jgi:D-tyrosyl-tRNA(Tyr) deacylase
MRALIQRVSRARVTVAGETVGEIGRGLLVLAGATHADGPQEVLVLANKIANLRIFEDPAGQMNRSALDLNAEPDGDVGVLLVSQFTLYADTRKGRRPSFVAAAPPDVAAPLVAALGQALRNLGLAVAEGRFGAKMAVELVNDGPVTIWLDTEGLGVRSQESGTR